MDKETAGKLIRYGLTSLGGTLALRGFIPPELVGPTADVLTGAAVSLGAILWSVYISPRLNKTV